MKSKAIIIMTLILSLSLIASSCKKTIPPFSDPSLLSYRWRFDSIASVNSDSFQKDSFHGGDFLTCTFNTDKTIGFAYGSAIFGNGTFEYNESHSLTCKNVSRFDQLGIQVLWVNIFTDLMNNSNSYSVYGNQLTVMADSSF
jgi:hypothetical protein